MKYASIVGVIAVIIVLFFTGFHVENKAPVAEGSINDGQNYNSTTTSGTMNTQVLLKSRYGTLGSVVITGTFAGGLRVFDATTTNSALRTYPATTTLANFQTGTTPGTYTFDTVFSYGLLIDTNGAGLASSTITWR